LTPKANKILDWIKVRTADLARIARPVEGGRLRRITCPRNILGIIILLFLHDHQQLLDIVHGHPACTLVCLPRSSAWHTTYAAAFIATILVERSNFKI